MQLTLLVNPQVFEQFPHFRRGVVVATAVQNADHDERLEALFINATTEARTQPIDLANDSRFLLWRQAHQSLGSNPNRFPPAHHALRKRAQNASSVIPFISRVVAIMNYNSLISCLPVGGDDLACIGRDLQLRAASGREKFIPLGVPEELEHPEPGELIYVDEAGQVMCRRWNWRNSHLTRIRNETSTLSINIDSLGNDSECQAREIRDRIADMLVTFCHARVTLGMLTPDESHFQCQLPT